MFNIYDKMAEKVKKKPSFLSFSKKGSDTSRVDMTESVELPTPTIENSSRRMKSTGTRPKSRSSSVDSKAKRLSIGGIKDLVQCALCMDVLQNAKMLPCQHTFCFDCLIKYVGDLAVFECPSCNTKIHVNSSKYLANLPSNLYIDSLLQLFGNPESSQSKQQSTTPPSTPGSAGLTSVELFASSSRCSQCQTVCDNCDVKCCDHCKQNYCKICWSQHLDDMQTQIGSILKQLESAFTKLNHKVDNYKDRCERLAEQINIAAEENINDIVESRTNLLEQAAELQKSGEMSALALQTSLEEAKSVANKIMTDRYEPEDKERVTTFMNLHQNALQLLTDVSKWDREHFVFDKANFRIELDGSSPLEAESDEPMPITLRNNNPLENEDTLITHYRSRNFVPHYVWRKTSRPGGVGVSPWNNHLYICGMDTHNVLIVERTQAKVVSKLSYNLMKCPSNIAFMKSLGEIYITDKWEHCIHVFSKDGEYLRGIGQKGSRVGMFRSPEGIAVDNSCHEIYVVDTGNDRVQVLTPDGKCVSLFGVVKRKQPTDKSVWQTASQSSVCTELNSPTSVAVTNDRVIILDSGNRRVKVYNKLDKNRVLEFGSLGHRKGQFRQPEVLTVDPLGFILVGDSGNSRVQVFKPCGQLVRVFGGLGTEPGKFGWISGIHVTKQLDIIISDSKNHNVNFI